jgi:hypothetical protein
MPCTSLRWVYGYQIATSWQVRVVARYSVVGGGELLNPIINDLGMCL